MRARISLFERRCRQRRALRDNNGDGGDGGGGGDCSKTGFDARARAHNIDARASSISRRRLPLCVSRAQNVATFACRRERAARARMQVAVGRLMRHKARALEQRKLAAAAAVTKRRATILVVGSN